MSAVVLTSTKELSHEEWLTYRNLGIGGSDASVVCGINKYKSPLELWMEKTNQKSSEKAGESAYWGTILESVVREEFTLRTGINVIPVEQIIKSKEYPFMLANLDGVCLCPTHGKCVFEAKTASAFKFDEWEGDLVPKEYILQIQHYLCVTGYNGAYIAVLIGGNDFRWKFVKRDEEIISMLINHEREFWMYVQNQVPPPIDGSDACGEFLSGLHPSSRPFSKIKLPSNAIDLIRQYNEADEQMEAHKELKQQASNALKEMLGDNEVGVIDGATVKWKTVEQEKINSKMLKTEQPELYKKYVATSSYRRFTIKNVDVSADSNELTKEALLKAS